MRGKKTDPKFVSDFIQECVTKLGIYSSDEIVNHAKIIIASIDNEIKMIEKKKVTRSKLLDVISAFEKTKKDKTHEAKLLTFFDLQYPKICSQICKSMMSSGQYDLDDIKDPEILFCIKQLLEIKIVARTGNNLVPGDRFNEYITFVLHEV